MQLWQLRVLRKIILLALIEERNIFKSIVMLRFLLEEEERQRRLGLEKGELLKKALYRKRNNKSSKSSYIDEIAWKN